MDDLTRKLVAGTVVAAGLLALPATLQFGKMGFNTLKGMAAGSRLGKKITGGSEGAAERMKENLGARMASNNLGQNATGRGAGAKRAAGSAAAYLGGRGARKKYQRESRSANAARIQQEQLAKNLLDEKQTGIKGAPGIFGKKTFAQRAAGPGGEEAALRAQAKGASTLSSMIGEDMKAAQTMIEDSGLTAGGLRDLAVDGKATTPSGKTISGELYQKAAIGKAAKEGRINILEDVVNKSTQTKPDGSRALSHSVSETLAYHLGENYTTLKAKGHGLNDDRVKAALSRGESVGPALREAASMKAMGGLTAEKFASQDPLELKHVKRALENNIVVPPKPADLRAGASESEKSAYETALANHKIYADIADNRQKVIALAKRTIEDARLSQAFTQESRADAEAIAAFDKP